MKKNERSLEKKNKIEAKVQNSKDGRYKIGNKRKEEMKREKNLMGGKKKEGMKGKKKKKKRKGKERKKKELLSDSWKYRKKYKCIHIWVYMYIYVD